MNEPAAWICAHCAHFIVTDRATPTHDCTVTGETTGFVAYVDSLQAETIRRQLPTARR